MNDAELEFLAQKTEETLDTLGQLGIAEVHRANLPGLAIIGIRQQGHQPPCGHIGCRHIFGQTDYALAAQRQLAPHFVAGSRQRRHDGQAVGAVMAQRPLLLAAMLAFAFS